MKIGRYTKLADGLRTTPVPPVQLAQATPLDARVIELCYQYRTVRF